MTTQSKNDVRTRAAELQDYIATGRIMEAMDEFYSDDVTMQENTDSPTVGLAANIEREKQFLSNIAEWLGFEVLSIAADGNVAFVESRSQFRTVDGTEVDSVQVSRSIWKDGKIVDERFYHQGYGE